MKKNQVPCERVVARIIIHTVEDNHPHKSYASALWRRILDTTNVTELCGAKFNTMENNLPHNLFVSGLWRIIIYTTNVREPCGV